MTSSNVAVRKPVRIAARWIARAEAVSPLIRMAMLVLTGMSTGLITLKQYGHGEFAWMLIVTIAVSSVVFTYFYAEEGIYNQQKRDRADLGQNYAGPTNRIDDEMIARGVVAASEGRTLTKEERNAVKEELDDAFYDLRDGIELKDA